MGGEVPGAGRFLGFMGRAIEVVRAVPPRRKPWSDRPLSPQASSAQLEVGLCEKGG